MKQYKLISLDNKESAGQPSVGSVGMIEYDGSVLYFSSIRTSTVRQITVNEDYIIVATKNSVYTFKEVEDV